MIGRGNEHQTDATKNLRLVATEISFFPSLPAPSLPSVLYSTLDMRPTLVRRTLGNLVPPKIATPNSVVRSAGDGPISRILTHVSPFIVYWGNLSNDCCCCRLLLEATKRSPANNSFIGHQSQVLRWQERFWQAIGCLHCCHAARRIYTGLPQ